MIQISSLHVGESRTFPVNEKTFRVKRISRDTWHLMDLSVCERSRFGSRKEIEEDMVYAVAFGRLPPAVGRRW